VANAVTVASGCETVIVVGEPETVTTLVITWADAVTVDVDAGKVTVAVELGTLITLVII
jgi:hypothetical protein